MHLQPSFGPRKIVAASVLAVGTMATAIAGTTTRISVDSTGTQANGGATDDLSISGNGRYTVFASSATNLVAGDSNGFTDVFVRDRKLGTTTRVSVDSTGAQATGGVSDEPSISANGRFVAFYSAATDLVPGDTNGKFDIFVHDRKLGTTTRVSVKSNGAQATGGDSFAPSISGNGRLVAFTSYATDLVKGDTNGGSDVFLHDRNTGKTTRVSVDSFGEQAVAAPSYFPSISKNGRFVAFASQAENLVGDDSNGVADTFVHDRVTRETKRVSIDSAGAQSIGGNSWVPSISANGRFVSFQSDATNLVSGDTNALSDIFLHDRKTGTTTRVSVTSNGSEAIGGGSYGSAISANGHFITFGSHATNLVGGDTNAFMDVFIHERKTGVTDRVSVTSIGSEATGGGSHTPAISEDGSFVSFLADATNLVAADSNALRDAFQHDRN